MVQLSLFSALALALPLVSGVTTPSCVLACATQNPDCTVIGDLACACGPGATKMDLCIKNSCSNDVNGGRLWFTNHCASLGYVSQDFALLADDEIQCETRIVRAYAGITDFSRGAFQSDFDYFCDRCLGNR